MAAVVILKEFVDEVSVFLNKNVLLKKLNAQTLHGEDYKEFLLKPEAHRNKIDLDSRIIDYQNFREDKQGNITADLIKYGPLRNLDDDQLFFVVRAFVSRTQQLTIEAIDVKY